MSSKHLATAVVLGAALLAASQPASTDGPFQFYPLTPCRLVDTRNLSQSPGGYGPALKNGERRRFPIQGNCLVPVGAKAVSLNVTAFAPTGAGNLGMYPSQDPAPPNTQTLNFVKGSTVANGAIAALADQSLFSKDLTIRVSVNYNGTVHVVLDVNGYFQ